METKRCGDLLDVFRVQAAAWRDARGVVLPLTLMILLILAGLVAALLSVGAMEPQIASNHLRGAQALDLAEAGGERAFAQFVADPSPVGQAAVGGPTVTLFNAQALQNLGTYTVTYRPLAASTVLVESTGTTNAGNVTQRVRMVVMAPPGPPPFAILGDNVQVAGNAQIGGAQGNIQGNTNTSVNGTGDKVSGTATTAGATCMGCDPNDPKNSVDPKTGLPKYVGDLADSGPGKPSQTLPTDTPMDYIKYADYILGDGITKYPDPVNGTIVPNNMILVVNPTVPGLVAGQLVPQNTGQFKGWTGKSGSSAGDWHFKGTTSPPGTYYASLEISIDTMSGTSAATPWKATLITGDSVHAGELELQANTTPYIVPYYQDLLGVGGAVKLLGNGVFTGTVISTSSTKSRPNIDCKSANCGLLMQDSVTLNGHIISDGLVQVQGTSKINYTPAGGAGAFGSPQILSWTRLAQ